MLDRSIDNSKLKRVINHQGGQAMPYDAPRPRTCLKINITLYHS